MPTRRAVVVTLALSLAPALLPAAAWADGSPFTTQVEKELRRQGFNRITVGRSWFGRILIHAESKTERREIVLNRHTGEILRDYSSPLTGGGKAHEDILGSHGGSSGSGGGGASGGGGGSSGGSGDGGSDGGSHDSSGGGSSDD
ncbi:hypothetical protein [Solirhodobacter olei]|uniref:hypothetical protein n=1 Tax=Solirhodobacter olei TaxID=2493082 RepID=UPI000FDA020F|nr:hypothetical protein [Solirhodobacter olei]